MTEIDQIIKSIVLTNKNVNDAYVEMEKALGGKKEAIDSLIYTLENVYNKQKEIKEQLSKIGSKAGIKREIEVLKQQKNELTKDLKLTSEQIEEYDRAVQKRVDINGQSKKFDQDLDILEKVELDLLILPSFLALSEDTAKEFNKITESIKKTAIDEWQIQKTKLKDKLCQKLKELKSEDQLLDPIITEIGSQINRNEAVQKISDDIRNEEERLSKYISLEEQYAQQCDKFKELLNKCSGIYKEYKAIHDNFQNVLFSNMKSFSEDLEFSVETIFKETSFAEKIEEIFDKRILKKNKKIIDLDEFEPEYLIDKEHVKVLIMACLDGTLRLTKTWDRESALRVILTDWYNSSYKVKMDGDFINEMSPGKKAIVLLKLIISLEESKYPILIDQPEDDLDNRSIFNDLIQFIRKKKIDRQIIVVTHNANVVLGGDAEEIIIANQDGIGSSNETYRFEYRSGAIEEDEAIEGRKGVLNSKGIQQHICEILEGGEIAFDLRKHKYQI